MPIARIVDADDRAPDVDAAGLDRRRAKKGADERGQKIFEPDARLPDPQLGGEDDAGERGQQARGDEGAGSCSAHRNAVERGGLRIGADRVEIAADRQIFERRSRARRRAPGRSSR